MLISNAYINLALKGLTNQRGANIIPREMIELSI